MATGNTTVFSLVIIPRLEDFRFDQRRAAVLDLVLHAAFHKA